MLTLIERHLVRLRAALGQDGRVADARVHRRDEQGGLLGSQVLDDLDLGYLGCVIPGHARTHGNGESRGLARQREDGRFALDGGRQEGLDSQEQPLDIGLYTG